jgi:hypothetical protein
MADTDALLKAAQTAIQNASTIVDPTRIVVSVRRKGPLFRRDTVIELDGAVRLAREVEKAEQIVRRAIPNVEVKNRLVAS